MLRLFRWLWKLFILASVFGIGYIIGREHSFEEDEDWEDDKDLSFDKKDEDKKKDESKIEPAGEKKADSPLQPKASETPQNAS
ncbi:hypothetical protein HYY75_13030, partial [bacterium]|nr:hypothetical protein [bacterium]